MYETNVTKELEEKCKELEELILVFDDLDGHLDKIGGDEYEI